MTQNANLFEPERKKRAHNKTHHKDAEAILRVLKDLWKMKQSGNLKGASKLLTKHNVSRLPLDIYLGFVEGKKYEDLTLDYAKEVKPLINKAKKARYGKAEPTPVVAEEVETLEDIVIDFIQTVQSFYTAGTPKLDDAVFNFINAVIDFYRHDDKRTILINQ